METWLTTQEAAKALTVSGSRIRAMVNDGLLVGEKRGRDLVISSLSVGAQKSVYGQLSTAMRIRVFVRDRLTCQECEYADEDPSSFHVHHVIARADGGTNEIENLITLCCDCHKEQHGSQPGGVSGQPYSVRLKDEARFVLEQRAEDWGISKTAVIERLLLATESTSSEIPSTFTPNVGAAYVMPSPDPASIPGVQKGISDPPKNAFCRHCEQKFAGPKGASTCVPCGRDGHVTTGDCRRCAQVARAKSLASSKTGADSPEVDYDWVDPT